MTILMSEICEEVFVQEIAELDFSPIYNCNLTTNDKFHLFYDQINSSRSTCPKRNFPKRRLSCPSSHGLLRISSQKLNSEMHSIKNHSKVKSKIPISKKIKI